MTLQAGKTSDFTCCNLKLSTKLFIFIPQTNALHLGVCVCDTFGLLFGTADFLHYIPTALFREKSTISTVTRVPVGVLPLSLQSLNNLLTSLCFGSGIIPPTIYQLLPAAPVPLALINLLFVWNCVHSLSTHSLQGCQ